MTIVVRLRRLPNSDGLPLPSYETSGAAGMDLRAALPLDDPRVLQPGQRALVPCGICLGLPEGFEAQVRPRSGLALKHGITCLNAPGTIDSDYRGEVGVILINHGQEAFTINRGERIAQLIISPVSHSSWIVVDSLDDTGRGTSGFGSTGR